MNQIRKNVWGVVAVAMVLLFCAACATEPDASPEGTPQPTATTVPAEQPGRAKELLDLLLTDQMNTTYSLYNFPSDYLGFVNSKFEYMDELVQQEDYVEVLLATYQEMAFLENRTIADQEENTAYQKEVREQADRIVLLEAMLATDEVFDRMSKEQKEQTLAAVQEKTLARGNGKYNIGADDSTMVNGFYAYIKEGEYTGSKWYEYIANGENTAAKNLLENACYPTDSIPVEGNRE